METDYGFYLSKAVDAAGPVSVSGGASGYFSSPQKSLDPHIFSKDKSVRPEVREWILTTLYRFWDGRFVWAHQGWSTVWLAGSGASYQWKANRGNGDLDILIGVDLPEFLSVNPEYAGLDKEQIADLMDEQLKDELWKKTANTSFHGQTYEVTFYVNPENVAAYPDIRAINPYAAYNLTDDCWTVRPPDLPDEPGLLYPGAFYKSVDGEAHTVRELTGRYNKLVSSPDTVYRQSGLKLVTQQARAMFDSIHLGRRIAFSEGGKGYGDYANFRWQRHKQLGTVNALRSMADVDRQAVSERDTALYGAPIAPAHEALTRAALWASRDRRQP